MTLVIAHRGASAVAPENTLLAFARAREQGADMIELDVQRSADNVLVVFHDRTTAHWNGQERPVNACTLAELRALDIGGERVPTLAEVCACAREWDIRLNVELKQAGIVADTVALLRAADLAGQVIISSFHEPDLRTVLRHAPDIQRGYLMGSRNYHPAARVRELWPFFDLRRVRASAWHPSHELPLLRSVVPLVRRAGYAVNVWTVNDVQRMRELVAWGATGIITDSPERARAAIASAAYSHPRQLSPASQEE